MLEFSPKISRRGYGLFVRIPKRVAESIGLTDGDRVRVRNDAEMMIASVPCRRKKWTEEELLRGITPDMCGPELIAGRMGNELI